MTKHKAPQVHPYGGKISVGLEERQRFKAQRESKGWDQKDLARRIGVTPATISNFENNRHPQVYKMLYAKLKRALFQESANGDDGNDTFSKIVDGVIDLPESQQDAVLALIEALKKR